MELLILLNLLNSPLTPLTLLYKQQVNVGTLTSSQSLLFPAVCLVATLLTLSFAEDAGSSYPQKSVFTLFFCFSELPVGGLDSIWG